MNKCIYLFIFLILLALSWFQPSCVTAETGRGRDQIRVAILKGADSVNLDGEGLLASDESGKPILLTLPLMVRVDQGRVQMSGVTARLVRVAGAGMVKVNGKSYRGVIELSLQSGKLLVVNQCLHKTNLIS